MSLNYDGVLGFLKILVVIFSPRNWHQTIKGESLCPADLGLVINGKEKKKRKRINRAQRASHTSRIMACPLLFSMPTDFQTETRSACVSRAEEKLIQLAEMVISDSFFSGCARWWLWVSGGDGDIGGGGGGGGDTEDTGGRKLAPEW